MNNNFEELPQHEKDLKNFEELVDVWDRGCIGTTRKENNAKCLITSYRHLISCGMDPIAWLTEAERRSVALAATYLGIKPKDL